MSSHGYPDFQRYAQWFGTPLAGATGLAIGAGSHTDGPLNVNNWSSVVLYIKPTGGTITATVRQTASGVPASLVSDTVIVVADGSTRVQSVVLLGNSVQLILQGSAGGETVDYSLVPSNTAVNTGTVSNPTIGVQHNDVLVASEAAIDLVDAGANVFAVVDDAANGRVKITPARVVTGYISAAGAILSGSGFTVVKNAGLGNYTITFNPAFAAAPLVLCGSDTFSNNYFTSAIAANTFTVNWYDAGATANTDKAFHFLAFALT